MNINKICDGNNITIKPEGWLDSISSPELGEVFDSIDSAENITLDFDAIEYIASSGVRQLVAAHQKAKELDASLSIINVCPEVMNIISLTGINKKMNIIPKNSDTSN